MDLGARIGWGIVIYAIVFLAWAGMSMYGFTQGVAPYLVEFLVLLVVCMWAGSELKFRTWKDILPYSIGWALIAIALDGIFVVPAQGWEWYSQWYAWVIYAFVVLLPLLSTLLRRSPAQRGSWES